jgi:superfamily II DNA or RNA helicase/HKD family nuclease
VARVLADGVYEDLVTEELAGALAALDPARAQLLGALADADAHVHLARHVGREIERVLAALPIERRAESASELVRVLLHHLATLVAGEVQGDADPIREQVLVRPPRRLLAIHRAAPPERPVTPLSMSTLLTRNQAEPAIGHELAREIATADRIDVLVAFITVGGFRRLRDALEGFSRGAPGLRMRVLTTTFTGTTEVAALDSLARLPGVKVKVSYDVRRTRLHAKAWLFHRDSGLTTAYVGSANFTATALGEGHEWMVKLCAADLPHVIDKFAGTFDTLWLDSEFEPYDPASDADRERLAAALRATDGDIDAALTTLLELHPFSFQEEILDRLATARLVHDRHRNLLVAATGTGKTVIAAIDYARRAAAAGAPPRMLFLAHRKEILVRSRDTFRHAMRDGSFGELLVGGATPDRYEHVFASIQGAAALLDRFGPSHFRHVVVDECHHVPARSYQDVVPHLRPDELVGLTATPERQDGRSLLPDFDGHVAAELRLWHALDRQLLAPFDYYGLADGTDLRHLRWTRTGYDVGALADLYTGHHARADLVLAQLSRRVTSATSVRALGFCVSIEHAEFMAGHFTSRGVPSLAVHSGSPVDLRDDAPRRLLAREVNVLFTCDLYNEGVDLPFVDTLLLLRPTMSATLFLQQLGRGLRLDPATSKRSCLVLDFIGQHREEFRFDAILSAFTAVPRARLREAVAQGFPFLPSGCSVSLDPVARETILDSLRTTLAGARRLAAELRDLATTTPSPTLADFLDATGRDLDDVYAPGHGWSTIRKLAGLAPDADEATLDLSRRLGWLTHVDEPTRLRTYQVTLDAARTGSASTLSDTDRLRWNMLDFQLVHRGTLGAAEKTIEYLVARPGIAAEFDQLRAVLEERVPLPLDEYPVPDWPLALHRHYELREILAAVSFVLPEQKKKVPQGGILRLPAQRRELLFVTLDKSGSDFSPTTRYRDYALSRDRFHWETQAAASVTRPSGRRYIDSSEWTFHLFVRPAPGTAYASLGPATYESHSGDRPVAITWRLAHPMPASLFDRYATLASG